MIENEIIDILIFKLCPIKYQKKYHYALFRSFINDLNDINKNISLLLNKQSTEREKILALWAIKSATAHLHYIIQFFYKYVKYLHRKKQLKDSNINFAFYREQSLIQSLVEIINIMFQIKYILPMKIAADISIKKALVLVNAFENHGHYLPTLSHNSTIHYVGNVLLYLRHTNKTIMNVYRYAIEPVVRNVHYKLIQLD